MKRMLQKLSLKILQLWEHLPTLPKVTRLNAKELAYKILFLNSCLIFVTWVKYEHLLGWFILLASYIISCFLFPVYVLLKYPREFAFWLYGYICLSEIPSALAKCGFQNRYDWIFFIPRMPVAIMLFCITILEISGMRQLINEKSLALINKILLRKKNVDTD